MDGPDVSAAFHRVAGPDLAEALADRLLKLADEAQDAAYASRLRAIARGDRPLRMLAFDPVWTAQFAGQLQKVQDDLARVSAEAEPGFAYAAGRRDQTQAPPRVTPDDLAEMTDVVERAARIRAAVREEDESGWSTVHESQGEDGSGDEH